MKIGSRILTIASILTATIASTSAIGTPANATVTARQCSATVDGGFDFAVRVCVQENELGQFNAVADIVAEQLTHVHVELIQCRGDGTACGDPGTGNDEDVSTLVNTNSSHQTYGQVRTDTLIEAM